MLRRLRLFGPRCALAALALTLVARARVEAAPKVETSAPATYAKVKINGFEYTEARAFFARYGLEAAVDSTGRKLTLSSAWTKVVVEADRREATFNGLRVFLGEPVLLRSRSLYLSTIDAETVFAPVLRPAGIPNPAPVRTIVIDAGHGGNDSGTSNTALKLKEKEFTLDVSKRLERLLSVAGYKVKLTRTDDRFVELADRAKIANDLRADLFISIHFNAVDGAPSVNGTETYAMTPRYQRSTSADKREAADNVANPGNRNDGWNTLIAYHIHRNLLEKLHSADRGLKHARFAVLRQVNCPAVLVEAGYLSNQTEAAKIAKAGYRDDIAEAVAAAVKTYAAAVQAAAR